MAATIRDIKEMTGLSLATISKYLNGGNLLPENKEKIEKAIETLHYEVNEMARGLVKSRSKTIGVVVFNIANVFTGTILQYLGERLREAGYAAMICDAQNDPQLEEENIRFLLGKKVDGLIVIPVAHNAAFLEPAVREKVPVVLMDRSLNDPRFDCVKVDNRAASYEAVGELAANGHRKIAIIGSDTEMTGRERLEGYIEFLRDWQIGIPEEYIKLGVHSIGHGYKSMRELLVLPDPPTAVFLGNFEIILGAVMALNESPFQCPKDISLIGFDDLIISHLSNPRMTLVVQPHQKMAHEAVMILLERLEAARTGEKDVLEQPHREVILPARIVEGETVAPCRD